MKKFIIIICAATMFVACSSKEAQLQSRATELCKYVPDHELLPESRDYMTADFYYVLDTMFNHLPMLEALDREWLYYFVTGNGGTIADFEVAGVEQTDKTHAVATVIVRQKWEDGSFDPETDVEEHLLYMEKQDGKWLMSDFDEHKADCIRYIENNRQEQDVRDAVSEYLIREIGSQYRQGELCIPTLAIVAAEETDTENAFVWGDFWVYWYNATGDTLKTVSGGNHAGRMTLQKQDGKIVVTGFEQTTDGAGNEASAKRIFGNHYDIYLNIHSNQDVVEAIRAEQLSDLIRLQNLPYRYYQDYGWDAVEL